MLVLYLPSVFVPTWRSLASGSVLHEIQADQRARMTLRACGMSLVVAAFLGCAATDRSITRGADGELDWQRQLSSAVPLRLYQIFKPLR